MIRFLFIVPVLLLSPVCVTAAARPTPRSTARHPAVATPPVLHIETVPPIVIERAQREAARMDNTNDPQSATESGGAVTLHHPPPVDTRTTTNRITQGQIVQITPAAVQLRERATNTVRTLTRGTVDLGTIKVGDHVDVTVAPGSDAIVLIAKNKD